MTTLVSVVIYYIYTTCLGLIYRHQVHIYIYIDIYKQKTTKKEIATIKF